MIVNSTIDKEALNLSKLATDLDKYRRRYSMREINDNEHILIQFVAPKIICFEEYRFFLYQNSRTEMLEPKFYYRPDYVSHAEYGTTNLWTLLMYINNIPTIEEFNKAEILIPTKNAILKISRDTAKRDIVNELVLLDELFKPETEKLFYATESLPKLVEPIKQKVNFVPSDLYYYKEIFIIDILTNKQRYIDLKYEPVKESLQMKIDGEVTYLYNKHYTILKNNGKFNRLTWDPRKIPNGRGLVDIISEGTEFEVQYARVIK